LAGGCGSRGEREIGRKRQLPDRIRRIRRIRRIQPLQMLGGTTTTVKRRGSSPRKSRCSCS
jgi:hypothetical protein